MAEDSGAPTISRRRLLRQAVFGLTGLALIDALVLEPEALELVEIDIPIPRLDPVFDGYRIAHLSDIHFLRGTTPGFLARAIDMANACRPDLFVFTGDFCDHAATPKVPSLKGLFERCLARDGVFGVLGNHDHWLDGPGVRRELDRNTPVRILENESVLIERASGAICLAGIGDLWEAPMDPQRAFWGRDPAIPRIMLEHNPDFADEMHINHPGDWCDLQLAGHTHGGQFKLPFGPAPVIPSKYGQKFRCGLVRGKSHWVYVNRGLTSLNRPRFLCRPEVTCITLRPVAPEPGRTTDDAIHPLGT